MPDPNKRKYDPAYNSCAELNDEFAKKILAKANSVRQKRLQAMSDPIEAARTILKGPDGERIFLLLVDHAAKVSRRYGWRTGMTLPQAQSPDAIATDVVVKVLEGKRIWDSNKEPSFINALKGMVRSELSHLFDTSDARKVESVAKTLPDGTERDADSFPSKFATPEEEALRRERTVLEMAALDLLLREVEGDSELESVLLALYETDSAEEIANVTGLTITRVYSLRRERQGR